jgi:hypothetical protein
MSDETEKDTTTRNGPLDGSVTGTIGGGGPDSGGPTPHPAAPEMPPAKPANAAGGRRAPEPPGEHPDELAPGPSDVTNH